MSHIREVGLSSSSELPVAFLLLIIVEDVLDGTQI